jgi:hypothetical protein
MMRGFFTAGLVFSLAASARQKVTKRHPPKINCAHRAL